MSFHLILPFFPEELRELLLDPSISDLMINGTTGVHVALSQAFHDAETLLLSRLGEVTLAELVADLHQRMIARGGSHDLETAHAS